MPAISGFQGRVLVTGANGQLGRRLLTRLASDPAVEPRAFVRSERARAALEGVPAAATADCVVADYRDEAELEQAAAGCRAVVHLVGVIKESPTTSYADAHEATCRSVAAAAERAGAERIVYLSIFGAAPDSPNACLASKGRAEEILLKADVPATVLRLPMVLGPGDPASRALRGQALAPLLPLVRGGATLEQPVDAEDVLDAILAAIALPDLANRIVELGGPESLPHRELVRRAAALHGRTPRIVPVPLALARALARVASGLMKSPPITPAMLGVLEHDDRIDPAPACELLGIELTPLDETLRRCVGPEASRELAEPEAP